MTGRRIGFYSLKKVAREMCRLIYKFTPVIKELYPDATTLHTALDAANIACGVMFDEIVAVETPGV